MASPSPNDITAREGRWRRWRGDEWACFDALPPAVRRRMQEHAYDPWAVNAHLLWRMFRRQLGSSARAERRLLRHLDLCEAMERAEFAAAYRRAHGVPLPHEAAAASVLRDAGGRIAAAAAPAYAEASTVPRERVKREHRAPAPEPIRGQVGG